MSTELHRQNAQGRTACCGILTISDTRTPEDDKSGQIIRDLLEAAGHSVTDYHIVRDESVEIEQQLRHWLAAGNLDVILTTGGTGIASRDTTVEVVERLLDKPLEGFGELFRMLSWDQVGAAAMLSRAIGGLVTTEAGGTLLFAMPGSTKAVTLAMEKLIIPELPHLIWERGR